MPFVLTEELTEDADAILSRLPCAGASSLWCGLDIEGDVREIQFRYTSPSDFALMPLLEQ